MTQEAMKEIEVLMLVASIPIGAVLGMLIYGTGKR